MTHKKAVWSQAVMRLTGRGPNESVKVITAVLGQMENHMTTRTGTIFTFFKEKGRDELFFYK